MTDSKRRMKFPIAGSREPAQSAHSLSSEIAVFREGLAVARSLGWRGRAACR